MMYGSIIQISKPEGEQMSKSELRKLIKALEEQGFTVTFTRNQHYLVRNPAGRVVATLAGTPSDHHAFRNMIATLRKAGFRWGR